MIDTIKIDKLSSFCKVIAGQSPKGSAYNENGIGVEFHQGKKAFGPHTIQSSNVWTTQITKLAQPGDILMSVRAPVGPTNFTNREVCIGRGLAAIRCKPEVLPQYILYVLKSIESKIVGKDGAVFNSISKDMIEDLPVPAVDKEEQQRIVDILDWEFAKIDALKANAEKSLQAAKDLFQATLKKELEPKEGWKTEKIGEVFEITDFVSNGSFASLRENVKYHDEPNYAVLVRLVDNSNGFDPNKFVYLDEHGYNFLAKSKLFGGELIMCNIGATIGTTFICPDLGMPMSIGPNSLLIRTPDNVFFNYYLQSQSFKKKLKGIIAKTTLEKFNKTQFKELVISFPEGQERKGIVSRLENLCAKSKTLQDNYQKTLALCDDLKQALLRKAFNGEL